MSNTLTNVMGATHSNDLEIARRLGSNMEKADAKFKKAVSSGDQSSIATAQLDLDQAQQELMGFMAAKKKIHDLIMKIIEMLRG